MFIRRCLLAVSASLRRGGFFAATAFVVSEAEYAKPRALPPRIPNDEHGIVTYPSKDPYHFTFEALQRVAGEVGMNTTLYKDVAHPRWHNLVVFSLPAAPSRLTAGARGARIAAPLNLL